LCRYERQVAITNQRKIDSERVLEQKRGAQTIVNQMKEREKEHLRALELKNQEGMVIACVER
jgi:hypothetical protein